jgi:hypothetical protein
MAYITISDAKKRLAALPADLDSETVQKCIEAIDSGNSEQDNVSGVLKAAINCREQALVFFDQCKVNLAEVVCELKNEAQHKPVCFTDIVNRVNHLLHASAYSALGAKQAVLAARIKSARENGDCDEAIKTSVELHLISELDPYGDICIERRADGFSIVIKQGVVSDIFKLHFEAELKCISKAFGFPILYQNNGN